jgi:hypothetical protein
VCIAFTLGCGDREAISRVETTSGTDGGDIRDVMIETRQAASGSLPNECQLDSAVRRPFLN